MGKRNKTRTLMCLCVMAGLSTACSSYSFEYEPVYEIDGTRQAFSAEDFHQGGIAHLRAGRIGLALHDLRRALSKDPTSVSTLNAIAVSYDELGRYDVARRYYERSLSLEPHSVQTLNNLAQSLLRQNEPQQALEYLKIAARIEEANQIVAGNLRIARRELEVTRRMDDRDFEENASLPTEGAISMSWVERTSQSTQTLVTLPLLGRAQALALTGEVPIDGATASPIEAMYRNGSVDGPIEVEDLTDVSWESEAGWLVSNGSNGAELTLRDEVKVGQTTIEVSNGAGRRYMAARMGRYLKERGFPEPRLTNADSFSYQESMLFYRPGYETAARSLAALLPVPIPITERRDQDDHIRLRLGGDLLEFDARFLIASKGF